MHKPVYNCGRGFDTVVWVRGQEYDPWVVNPRVPAEVDQSPNHRLKHGEGRESDEFWRPRFAQYLRNRSRIDGEEATCLARVIRQAGHWLEQAITQQNDRLFLWVDLFDPHEPWDPPPPYDHLYRPANYGGPDLVDPVPGDVAGYMIPDELANTKALYAGEITWVDKWMGVLFEKLKSLELWDNTLIMHVSDHGEPFGKHDYVRKAFPRAYQELVHVPWVIRHPDGMGADYRVEGMVQTVDLLPTLLELMGIEASQLKLTYTEPQQSGASRNIFPQDLPASRKRVVLTGHSLVPLLDGSVEKIRDFVCGGHHNREWFIKDPQWSYLLPIDGTRRPELYDLGQDPGEQDNVADRQPEQAASMELQLRRFVHELDLREMPERD